MKNTRRLTVQIEFYYNPYEGLPDPRKLDEFNSSIAAMKDIFSCSNILFYDEIYSREDFIKEDIIK